MPSSIAWLDTSAEQRRQANEIIALFTQEDSRDELGIGTVRDALSNLLFPGTSVLLTRTRYCLFVPWCFQIKKVASEQGAEHVAAAEQAERLLVESLIVEEPDSGAGVIGRRIGREVRNLPSTIYWGTLTAWGITPRTSVSLLGRPRPTLDAATELDQRADSDWHADMPKAPGSFPYDTAGGFALERAEAEWLRDRVLSACPDTALATLLSPDGTHTERLAEIDNAAGPWDVPALAAREDVHQAATFSLVLEGANLIYNLLVAELCAEAGLTTFDGRVDKYRDYLTRWADELDDDGGLATWDLPDFWSWVARTGKPPTATRAFVETWTHLVQTRDLHSLADDQRARDLVAARERRKGKQSRLVNERMLPTWSGASATERLTFRWAAISGLARDILEGLEA